ncbi:MAG: hypothetical protein ACI9O0_001133, partial [Paracoccaceae bacterium]
MLGFFAFGQTRQKSKPPCLQNSQKWRLELL